MEKEQLINAIIQLEWKQFDQVQNEGGRASCQDDWRTFEIMRKSQYVMWTDALLESIYVDYTESNTIGRNMVAEKYGRMMESTAPASYEQMKHLFPKRSEERCRRQEAVIAIQVAWMEEYGKKYPHVSGGSRNVHTSEDTPYQTSFETYLRGEMGTFSDQTFTLYEEFIHSLKSQNKNLSIQVIAYMLRMQGYGSLEEAEEVLKNKTF